MEQWTYTYDALDRLTHVTDNMGLSVAYTYDALGQRIGKKVNGTVTRFIWRSGHVAYETDSGFNKQAAYVWGMETDDLVAIHRYSGNTNYYVVQDRLRSVRATVQRNGTWKAAWRYELYGTELSAAGTLGFSLRFRWAGAQYDEETGFYYLRARYYDPEIGRFVQEDPAGLVGGTNAYAYVGGDPTQARDPMGTMARYDKQYRRGHIPAWQEYSHSVDDWDGNGVPDGEDWAAFAWAVHVIKLELAVWELPTRDAMFVYYGIQGAARGMDFGAAAQEQMQGVISQILAGSGESPLSAILPVVIPSDPGRVIWGAHLGRVTGEDVMSINADFFFLAGEATAYDFNYENLKHTLAHELFHRAAWYAGVEVPHYAASCYADRVARYVNTASKHQCPK